MIFSPLNGETVSTCSELVCDGTVAIGAPPEATWVISVGLLMFLTVGYVQEGIETCQKERDYVAAERGYVDMVIEPATTRPVLINAFEMLRTKKEERPNKKHGNIPL